LLTVGCVWRAVQALAQALLEQKTLDGEEATSVVAAWTERAAVE
jgi:hypothetical protein